MAIIYFSYLFEDLKFLQIMSPIIPELEVGNYQPLFDLAKATLDSKPELWNTLYDLNLGYSFIEETEGQLDPNSLLMKVLVQFLDPIPIPDSDAWRMLKSALPQIGWSNDETNVLIFGRSLCTLLIPNKKYPPTSYYDLSKYQGRSQPWCEGYIGWLDIKIIDRLYQQLTESKETFLEFAKQPSKAIQEEFSHFENFSLEWLSKKLIVSYESKMQELSIAHEARKAIAMTIA